MRATNPATETPLQDCPEHAPEQVNALLDRAVAASSSWRDLPIEQRAAIVRKAANILRNRRRELAELMTREMGKPISAALDEIEKCAGACEHFAEHGPRYLEPETIASDAARSFVRYEPLGAVLAIMPWNFPFWQVFRFAATALVAGNVGLLKHAPNVPGCGIAIESVFAQAGAPAGVFTNLLIDNDQAAKVIADDRIAAVTLTGSERAGSSVAATAGRALKKTVMELGGSDPFIILSDADLESTAKSAAKARCVNSGQSCIAAKRFIFVGDDARRAAAFEEAFAKALRALVVGDPTDPETEIGPLARLDLLEHLDEQVRASIAQGARLVTGGKRLPMTGYYFAPTLLADVKPGMAAFDEETFGPVAALTRANTIDDAVRLANQSRYGLGASIWTRDISAAEKIAPRLQAGSVFINGPVHSDARLPFGGVKRSGWGRELGAAGIREFVNVKTVWIGKS